jgi:hypothetical protein
VQFTDAVEPLSGVCIGDEVTALTPSAACAGAETNTGAIRASISVINADLFLIFILIN